MPTNLKFVTHGQGIHQFSKLYIIPQGNPTYPTTQHSLSHTLGGNIDSIITALTKVCVMIVMKDSGKFGCPDRIVAIVRQSNDGACMLV